MYILAIVIALIILIIKNDKLSKENTLLRKKIKELENEETTVKEEIIEEPIIENESINAPPVIEKKIEPIIKKEPKHTEKEIKNSSILIVGSFLIVLSAILFLTTTWNITHDLLKTFVLVIMLFVFLIASYLAENVLKIKQTAKAFHYIALSYIPIIFGAIFTFGLFGDYLSYNGDGNYLFLAISSIIVSIIYLVDAKKNNNSYTGYGCFIFMLLSTFFIGRSLTDNYNYINLLITIFVTGLLLTYKNNNILIKDKIHLNMASIYSVLVILIMIASTIYDLSFSKVIFLDIINESLILFMIYLFINIYNIEKVYKYIYPLYIVYISFSIGCIYDSLLIKEALIMLSFVGLFIYEMIAKQKISKMTYFSSLAIGNILVLNNIFSLESFIGLPYYLIELVETILSLVYYLYNKEKYSSYITTAFGLITPLVFLLYYGYNVIYEGYIALAVLIISLLIPNSDYNKPFNIIGNIAFIIISLCLGDYNVNTSILFALFTIYHLFISYKDNKAINKLLFYIYTNVCLFNLAYILPFDYKDLYYLVIPFTTLVFYALETFIVKFKDNFNKIYLIIQFIVALFLLFVRALETKYSLVVLTIAIITNIAFILFQKSKDLNDNYKFINYGSLIPFLFLDYLKHMNPVSIFIVIVSCYLLLKKNKNVYLISSYAYVLLNMITFDNSKYIILALYSAITICAYFVKADKSKRAFQALCYVCGTIFLEFVLDDLGLIEKEACTMFIPVMILIPVYSRTILKPYNKDYKALEYITYILLNLIALVILDDLEVFVGVLVATAIISYLLKLGPIFIISLIFLVLNVIRLTIDFWLSIPWWIYILVIGSILVFFAMHNELKENKEKRHLLEKLKKELDL